MATEKSAGVGGYLLLPLYQDTVGELHMPKKAHRKGAKGAKEKQNSYHKEHKVHKENTKFLDKRTIKRIA
jgi:hypothetical protein